MAPLARRPILSEATGRMTPLLTCCTSWADRDSADAASVRASTPPSGRNAFEATGRLINCHAPKLRRPTAVRSLQHVRPPTTDVFFEGDCDAGVRELARLAGMGDELTALIDKATGGATSPRIGATAQP